MQVPTWQQVTNIPGGTQSVVATASSLASSIYRHGVLYAMLPSTSPQHGPLPQTFAFSTNDGHTWTRPEQTPSTLERAGWEVDGFAADYQSPQGWYRSLTKPTVGAMLEHSSDDGATWTTVGPIGSLRAKDVQNLTRTTLATTPARPQIVCAADAANAGTWLAASADGGHSWRGGPSQRAFAGALFASFRSPVQIGNDGTCYSAYTYATDSNNGVFNSGLQFHCAILQLGPRAHRSTVVPLASSVSLDAGGQLPAPDW